MRKNIKFTCILWFIIMTLIAAGCNVKEISSEEKIIKYLDKNNIKLTFNDDNELSNNKEFNKDISKYDVFLFGYEYGSKINNKIEMKFFKYLNNTIGVKNYIGAMQYSEGGIINKYIQTGDQNILNKLFKLYKGTEKWTSENYNRWISLHKYNALLESDKKIRIYGLGMEDNPSYAFLYLSLILPDSKAPNSILKTIEAIKNYEKVDDIKSIKGIIREYNLGIKNFKYEYERYLGEDFEEFNYVMENLKDVISLYDSDKKDEDYYVYDEEKMYSNFIKIYSNIGPSKFYGNFPISQVFKKRESSDKHISSSFAARINSKNSPTAKRVFSAACIYKNSSRLFADKKYNYVPLNNTGNGMDIIGKRMTDNITMLNVNKLFSPFKRYGYFLDKGDNGGTTDYFNYAFLIKDSDAENPIKLTDYNEYEERILENYLKSNCSSIVTDLNDMSSFKLMDNDSQKYDVFLAGETHGVSFNTNMEATILKYLNQRAGVRYYLGEFGYSMGMYINKYLETGDEVFIKDVYKELKGTYSYSQESYDKWKKIYEYNRELPEDKKIKVIGIDVEHQMNTAWRYVNSILPKDNPPDEILDCIRKIKDKVCAGSETEDKQLLTNIIGEIQAHPNAFKAYFRDDYFDFVMIIKNILNAINMYQGKGYNYREDIIYQNFIDVYKHYPNGKYFGQWGSEHTFQKDHENQCITNESFATRLKKKDSPIKGKVATLLYIYTNCMRMTPQKSQEMVGSSFGETLLLNSFADSNYTLFKLNGLNSPFAEKSYIVESPIGGVTLDYFQYVVVIKNSPQASIFIE